MIAIRSNSVACGSACNRIRVASVYLPVGSHIVSSQMLHHRLMQDTQDEN